MRIKETAKIRKRTKKASNMSEGPNENCELYENYIKLWKFYYEN